MAIPVSIVGSGVVTSVVVQREWGECVVQRDGI